ncbi:MAG: HEAT repeat domain-containing protein [Vicinamibacteraceae bacterium]
MRVHEDYIDPGRYEVDKLRRVVFELEGDAEREGLSRVMALHLLGHKDYPGKMRDLKRLLVNEAELPRLRQSAAILLGRVGTRAAATALENATSVKNDLARRGVVEGLAIAGREGSLEALAALAKDGGVVGRAVARTTRLLRHRLRAKGSGLRPDAAASTLKLRRNRTVPIQAKAARGKRVETAIAQIVARHPALTLSDQNALAFDCQGRELLFIFDRAVVDEGQEVLLRAKAQAGVVAEHTTIEGDVWEPKYHVLTEPRPGGTVAITACSSRGVVHLAGAGRAIQRGMAFTLVSIARPGAVAVEVTGVFADGRLTITRARSERTRSAALEPTLRRRA